MRDYEGIDELFECEGHVCHLTWLMYSGDRMRWGAVVYLPHGGDFHVARVALTPEDAMLDTAKEIQHYYKMRNCGTHCPTTVTTTD